MKQSDNTPFSRVAFGYVRLSRDDARHGSETLDEQFALRAAICQTIARQYNLLLPPENILVEQESGSRLANRPKALHLLALAHQGKLKHLITPYEDRLLRGDKRDEADIEDALCAGAVTLYHTEGQPIHFGPDWDPLVFEVKALVARQEVRSYAHKMRTTNRERLRQATRFTGSLPYAYRLVPAQHDERGNKIADPRIVAIPEELEVVREIFARALSESHRAIAGDLNTRGVPNPGLRRSARRGHQWSPNSIGHILHNHWYMGYQIQKSRVIRGKTVMLPPEEWIVSEVRGDWEAAVSEEEWEAAQRAVAKSGSKPGKSQGTCLLTGLLYCAQGSIMNGGGVGHGHRYACWCGQAYGQAQSRDKERHTGWSIKTYRIEPFAGRVLATVLAALPDTAFETPKKRDRPTVSSLSRLKREREAAQRSAADMIARREWHVSLFGEAAFEQAAMKVRAEMDRLDKELADAERAMDQPDLTAILPLLRSARARGREFWESADPETRRAVLFCVVRRIELVPTAHRERHSRARVTLWDWCQELLPPGVVPETFSEEEMPPHDKRGAGGRFTGGNPVSPAQ